MILFASEYVCIQRICIFHHHDFSDWLNISVYLELSLLKLWLGPAKTMPCHKYPCQGLIVISINTFVLYSCIFCIVFGICVSYLYFVGPAKTMPCHKYYCQGLIITSINTLVFVPYCISVFVFCICILCGPSQDNALSQVPLSRAHRHI